MEQNLKKKLQRFLGEMHKFGTVKGFKNFNMYLRGREEMLITILNEPESMYHEHHQNEVRAVFQTNVNPSDSFNSQNLPYDKSLLMMSHNSQLNQSGFGDQGVGLPPASPSEEEPVQDSKYTTFLLAGYAKYSCPYIWVRTNHRRLVQLSGGANTTEKDSPLRLKSTSKWKDTEVKVWEVIAELIKLCTHPVPRNPFEVDVEYVDSLPLKESVYTTAGLVNCLQQILLFTKDEKHYSGLVFDDLHFVTKKHFQGLLELTKGRQLSVVELALQEKRKQQAHKEAQSHARSTQRKRYPSQTYTEQAAIAYGLQPMHDGPAVQSTRPVNQYEYSQNYSYNQAPSMF